ncbi:MAG TPA: DrmB family protein [Rhizomicrobium sp.]|nr:DrmB family protein [Rhizomicrobium sp.]
MTRITQSVSQLLTSFGPGAMMDLPTRSVIVAGLEHWDTQKGRFKTVEEPRLAALLQQQLVQGGRWEAGKPVRLRTPPIAQETRDDNDPAGVAVRVFPTWFTCEDNAGGPTARRRLVPWSDLEASGGRAKYQRDDGKKVDVTPIRFVAACKNGHLQDIDWRRLMHRGAACSEPMWIEEEGTSADPANIRIGCQCGRPALSLADAFKPGFLGRCRGQRPWLDSPQPGCEENLHFLSRAATNTYFAQTVTVISLPIHDDALGDAIRKHWSSLQSATGKEFVGVLRNVPEIGAVLQGYSDEAVFARIQQMREQDVRAASIHPKIEEFDLLGSGRDQIGRDADDEPLFAETLPRAVLANCTTALGQEFLESVVAVHRLRAVTCLYGFTRLEPAATMSEALLEEVRLAVDGAPLSEGADWLPALEQKGEGIFVKLNPGAIRSWLGGNEVVARGLLLDRGLDRYRDKYEINPERPGIAYVALHTLAHAIMDQIALESGYPFSSLRERVYAIASPNATGQDRFGILIYTAGAGAQGTLGGLVEMARRIPELINSGLERLRLCSNDPICADHDPSMSGDERSLHGAACHACLLVPETSCEARNVFLDRALLVETLDQSRAELFNL